MEFKGAAGNLNFQPVSLGEFSEVLRDRIIMGEFKSTVMGIGKSGIGKTESIKNAVCDPLGLKLIDMRLSTMDETDLAGFPIPVEDKETGERVTKYSRLAQFPENTPGVAPGILLFDEFTAASQGVRKNVAKLLEHDDRKIGDYTLPDNWLVVILGNGPGDGGVFDGLEYHLMDRSEKYNIILSFDEWKSWALANRIHPVVLAFIESHGKEAMLHRISGEDAEFATAGSSPRSWTMLSRHLINKEKILGRSLSERQVSIYAGGAVGSDIAVQFATYYKFRDSMISLNDIASGKILSEDLSHYRMESIYITLYNLVANLTPLIDKYEKVINDNIVENKESLPDNVVNIIRNSIKFAIKLSNEVQVDYGIMFFLSLSNASKAWNSYMLNESFYGSYPESEQFLEKNVNLMSTLNSINSRK